MNIQFKMENQQIIPTSSINCEPAKYKYTKPSNGEMFQVLQSLRHNKVFCDIELQTQDGYKIFGHKVILASSSTYFHAMFTHFAENNKDIVVIRQLDSTTLQQLVDFIYSGKIMVTENNVQVLLPAANLLQLNDVNETCCEFLQKQLHPTNCLGIKAFADLHSCTKLLTNSELYIQQNFSEVIEVDEFLSVSSEQLVKFISSDALTVPSEEKVLECVMKWVKHDLDQRIDFLPELMEHVRLPLLKPDILFNISEEPLLNNSPNCYKYIIEAFRFNLQKSFQNFVIPKTVRCKPRQFGGFKKVILIFNRSDTSPKCCTEWYYPATKLRENGPGLNDCRETAGLAVIRDQFVFAVGGVKACSMKSVSALDVSSQSPSWVPMIDMLADRHQLGVCVLDDYIYAVGAIDFFSPLNSVEVFDVSIQKWRMVSSMSITRYNLGVGVLNNFLYAVGGVSWENRKGGEFDLKSVERYDPGLDTWTPVADMSVCRNGVGVGVLDGVMYAIGGYSKSVEVYRPSDGLWSFVADMHLSRYRPGVVALDGLLYVFGGEVSKSIVDSVEIYNPNTNTWTMETLSRRGIRVYGGVVVDRPHN